MKKLLLAAMLAALVVACAQPAAQTSSEIPPLAAEWVSTYNAGDIEGLKAMYAEDCQLLPPNAEMVTGRSGVEAVFGAMSDAGLIGATETVEAIASGDLAYHLGRYEISTPDGSTVDRGKFIEIWRQVGGEWKISRDVWNSDMSAAPATSAGDTYIFTHEVEDPEVWLAAWRGPESRKGLFAEHGASSVRVFQSPDEPNLTGLLVQATDMEALQAMIASPEGQAAATEDTVQGDTIKVLAEVE